jgi:Ran GTPase-activating protein (RanGAP) involved in mRNA processing and transport
MARTIRLDLSGNAIGAGGGIALASLIASTPSLTEIVLDSNALTGAGADAIAQALVTSASLRTLVRSCLVVSFDFPHFISVHGKQQSR